MSSNPGEFTIADDWKDELSDRSTIERVYDAAVQLSEESKVSTVADRANVSKETARKYLEFFATVGVVRKTSENPDVFVRNESYMTWREREHLRSEYSLAELREELKELGERDDTFREKLGVDDPSDVSLLSAGYAGAGALTDVVEEWRAVRRRADDLVAVLEAESKRPGNSAVSSVNPSDGHSSEKLLRAALALSEAGYSTEILSEEEFAGGTGTSLEQFSSE